MIKIDSKTSNYYKKLKTILDRRRKLDTANFTKVSRIIADIKKQKKKALIKYEIKYSKNAKITLPKKVINRSVKTLNREIKSSIDFAYNRIMKFHMLQKKNLKNIYYLDKYKNKLQYNLVPIQTVGIYVPANLPSSLLMNAIPAKVSKVKKIILATPKLDPAVMYAAKKVGIKEIYFMGGAQAIASLAYIQNVDKIIGPGNDYVARAKREVFGDVGIEGMIAGPSEITIVADKTANPDEIITSMIGQAEHDINSQSILITKNLDLINYLKKNLFTKLKEIPRKKIAKKSLLNNGLIIKVYNDNQIINIVNEIAPEHLELNSKNYNKLLKKIKNAGSICIGKYSAMAVTDYNVGTNHVLPTLGSAKFSSGLNVGEFYKKTSYIKLSKKGIEVIGKKAITLAEYEGLNGHALSIKSRFRRN